MSSKSSKNTKTSSVTKKLGSKTSNTDSKSSASVSKTNKTGSKSNKLYSKTSKLDFKSNKTGSESNKTGSKTTKLNSKSNKSGSKTNKLGSKSNKTGSKTSKLGSKTNKSDSKTSKLGSKTNKSDSKTSKLGSRSNKSNSKTSKLGSKNNKSNSKTSKLGSKTDLLGSKTKICSLRTLCDDESCLECFKKSFASDERSDQWSDKNDKEPRQVFKNSHLKYFFDCDICGHEFEMRLYSVTRGSWCGYCNNNLLCEDDDCYMCLEKSFLSNERAITWSEKNDLTSRQVFENCNKKFFFDCDVCDHNFEMSLLNINNGQWCSFCKGNNLCSNQKCKWCYNRSFASHERAKKWSEENKCSPREVFLKSNKKFKFNCNKCNNIFSMALNNICAGQWCPLCVNKTEKILFEKLSKIYTTLIRQFNPDWCINKETARKLPFDLLIPEKNIIIELDGPQHFKQVSNWKSCEFTHKRDINKMKMANRNGFCVIRILQEDVLHKKYKWKPELIKNIKILDKSKYIENIYMCQNNEYAIFDHYEKK